MAITKLTILIPVYNEDKTITTLLNKIVRAELPPGVTKELIIIDDFSTDGTEIAIHEFIKSNSKRDLKLEYIRHDMNRGKGASIQSGIKRATGEFLIVQDADLEYDPNEYGILLAPVVNGFADVVYGSRFVGGRPHRILFFWHTLGNRFLTFLSNAFTNLNLTDIETCYKLFNTKILKSIVLKEHRFGFEPEVTAKIARIPGIRIYEVGISYYGRTYEEGKKIGWKDGMRTIWCILKYGFFKS